MEPDRTFSQVKQKFKRIGQREGMFKSIETISEKDTDSAFQWKDSGERTKYIHCDDPHQLIEVQSDDESNYWTDSASE